MNLSLNYSFRNKCDKSYLKALEPLEREYLEYQRNHKNSNSLYCHLLIHRSYLLPETFWTLYMSLTEKLQPDRESRVSMYEWIQRIAREHFCFNSDYGYLKDYRFVKKPVTPFHKLLHCYPKSSEEEQFKWPHKFLANCFEKVENSAVKPLSKEIIKKYNTMKTLFDKIYDAQNDTEKWFHAVTQVDDSLFICNNVEYRLGKNLHDKTLWKLYLDYLKHNDIEKMLMTYSKYCRFFLDDLEMRNEYMKVYAKYRTLYDKSIDNFWYNMMDIEKVESTKMCDSYISYILKHANSNLRRKLFQSSKALYLRIAAPVYYGLEISMKKTSYESEVIKLHPSDIDKLKNACISTWIKVIDPAESYLLSNILTQIYRSDVKYIELTAQILTYSELSFLLERRKTVKLHMVDCELYDEKMENLAFEKLCEMLPKIQNLRIIGKVYFTSTTGETLANQKFEAKLHKLDLQKICGQEFDVEQFFEYIKVNRDYYLEIECKFQKNNYKEGFVQRFNEILENYGENEDSTSISLTDYFDISESEDEDETSSSPNTE